MVGARHFAQLKHGKPWTLQTHVSSGALLVICGDSAKGGSWYRDTFNWLLGYFW